MARKNRTVADRQQSLEPDSPAANFTLAGVRLMYGGIGGKEFHCRISEYCRTQVFEFPGIEFHPGRRRASPHDLFVSLGSRLRRFEPRGLLRELGIQ